MEEKERYELIGYCSYRDIETGVIGDNFVDILNKQDKRIKELEEENKVGDFWHSAYQGKQLEYDQVYAELRKVYEENQQLKEQISKMEETHKRIMSGEYIPSNIVEKSLELNKQSQKELAIEELEKLKETMSKCDEYGYLIRFSSMNDRDKFNLVIDNQIKELERV